MKRTSRLPHVSSRLTLISSLAALSFAACGLPPDGSEASASKAQGLAGLSVPRLGSATNFAVLGASTVTCTNAASLTGNVGVSPGTAITGFNPDCTVSGSIEAGSAPAASAHNDLVVAYNGLTAVACEYNLTGTDLGGMTLAPGVYCFDSSVGITGELTLDGGGDSNAVWIFQIASTITTGTNAAVVMSGNGQACNVFWQVGSSATIGVGTAMKGNLLAYASITMVSGSSLVGRALALNAAVTMDGNSIAACSSSGTPGNPPPPPPPAPQFCAGKDRISGEGWFKPTPSAAKSTFAIKAGIRKGAFFGHLTFKDHRTNGPKVQSQNVTAYIALDSTTRRIIGMAKVNGQPGFTYQVDVSDKAIDTFSLVLSNGYSTSGIVKGGQIKLKTRQGYAGACKGSRGNNADHDNDNDGQDGDDDGDDDDDDDNDDDGQHGGNCGSNHGH